MQVVKTVSEAQKAIATARADGKKIGFIPTMGALHDGHLSLMKLSANENDFNIVSIFVNPVQFNDKGDFNRYPRKLDDDLLKMKNSSIDLVFAPTVDEMYPVPDNRKFLFGALEEVMEGKARPGHFNGVAIVVSKLFEIITPHKAYFGEKDFQQLAIIRKMTASLKYPIEIVACPIVRETDGLAMSSRNALLNSAQRELAPEIYKTLVQAKELSYTQSPIVVKKWVIEKINSYNGMVIDYFELSDIETLQPVNKWEDNTIGCIAVFMDKIRLIDNLIFR